MPVTLAQAKLFLPTPSHGGRPLAQHKKALLSYFYPRPHMEGDALRSSNSSLSSYFYPRPHLEGDKLLIPFCIEAVISTHALTWRATSSSRKFNSFFQFLPTPSHGGRPTTERGFMQSQ